MISRMTRPANSQKNADNQVDGFSTGLAPIMVRGSNGRKLDRYDMGSCDE
jgi:hypothetical protein